MSHHGNFNFAHLSMNKHQHMSIYQFHFFFMAAARLKCFQILAAEEQKSNTASRDVDGCHGHGLRSKTDSL